MGLIDNIRDGFRFKDTIFLKENSDLQERYDALIKLNNKYPNNEDLLRELYIIKKGLTGENEIAYQLKKASIGMYVLRDIKLKYQDLTAQIDYVVITPVYIYYIECKNLVGNIIVTDKGDFIRELVINGKKIRKAMPSPLRQVEAQREVVRKIWESKTSKVAKLFSSAKFNYYRRVLVVAANQETILNTSKAPYDIKYKILRADALIRQIEYDLNHKDKDEPLESQKKMEELAKSYLALADFREINYYEYYENKYNLQNDNLKERLINLRSNRAKEMNIPAYYVFTNKELEKLITLKPKTIADLKNAEILANIKIKTHGEAIVSEINKENKNS